MTLARPPFDGLTCLAEETGPTPLGPEPERAESVTVRAHDGTSLATDVYLPAGRGRFSAVLCRLPYDKTGDHAWIPAVASRLVDAGFAFVAQDVRGKARSDGAREPFVHEAADGSATLDWIEAQRWSNGRIGMWGQSYYGYTQWAAAMTGHRALRCIVPQMTATAIGREWMYRQGVFQLQTMAEWGVWAWTDRPMLGFTIDWRALPVRDLPQLWCGRTNPALETWLLNGPRSGYWARLPAGQWEPRKLRAAVMSTGGFWDVFQRGQIDDHLRLASVKPPSLAHLRMASRDHFGSEWVRHGERGPDYEHDPELLDEALDRYIGNAPDWYHACLNLQEAPQVRRVEFQIAGDDWHHADSWPPPDARPRTFWLRPGALCDQPGARRSVGLGYDPENPVPSLDENPWRTLFDPSDRREIALRDDVAVFDSQAFREPLMLAGPTRLRLPIEAESSAVHVHARLVDVAAGGSARLLGHGAAQVLRGRRRTIDLGHLAIRLERGHRLRLELSATDFPRYARAGVAGDWRTATSLTPGRLRYTLDHGATLQVTTLAHPTGRA
ncbi:MAG TPA: CocE/NonD family hydrolase [Gaiellales bacterium]|nr:CocE/NonD family hydrolase [Gaiellales bacterium]